MKWQRCVSVIAGLVLTFGSAAQADVVTHVITHGSTTISMDFVTVGNPGNVNDTHGAGYGAVDYVYQIGKYEVTAAQWAAVCVADFKVGHPWLWWSGSQPAGGQDWYEAAKFCNWLTTGSANSGVYNTSTWAIMDHQTAGATYGTAYFLPTEDEWYKAAYYDPNKRGAGIGGYWDYPTQPASSNSSNVPPDGIDFAGDTAFDAVFDDGYEQAEPNSVDNAGVLSVYGTMGQGGNVLEWNETAINGRRVLRGGHWYDVSFHLLAFDRSDYNPEYGSPTVGFRVAAVPEPGSITLMLCGALAGMLWRRRRT